MISLQIHGRQLTLKRILRALGGVNRAFYYLPHKLSFKEFHHSCIIKAPIIITPQFISLGRNVFLGHHARIEGIKQYNSAEFNPKIILADNVSVQQNLHLTCANRIEIGENTAIAANVTITDIHHPYDDVETAIERQDIIVKEVIIGADSKIYNNAVILPGVHIGKHVTIGANSVVTQDIPDYSVAVGAPAKVIKKYNFESNQWEIV